MHLVVAASVIAFVTTEMDDLLVLVVLFCGTRRFREQAAVVAGHYAGVALLVAGSKFFAPALAGLPVGELLGVLGIVPIGIGIRMTVRQRYAPQDSPSVLAAAGGTLLCLIETAVITLAHGGDNISVYIPFFAALGGGEFAVCSAVFAALQALWCLIAFAVMQAKSVRDFVGQSRTLLVPFLFVILGVYILLEEGTVLWFFGK